MTKALENLWKRIEDVLETQEPEAIFELFEKTMAEGNEEKINKHELYYAAGYVGYMHPEGKKNTSVRKQTKEALTLSLFYHPGFLPSVLYLAFIKMDEMSCLDALGLLFSCNRNVGIHSDQLIDRYVEATVCCLVECGFWSKALLELEWFDQRVKKDAQVGMDLINFMRLIEKVDPLNKLQENVLRKIQSILECEF